MAEWRFPILSKDAVFSGGADKFAIDRKIHNLVREAIQNVYDQRRHQNSIAGVKFSFHDLAGKDLSKFLRDINWNEGLREHLDACATGLNHDKGKIKSNLDSLNNGEMRVLIISDHETNGLNGPEYGEEGNFCKLCRSDMMPSTEQNSHKRGGAFGVGKSVYWAFSGVNTVIFSSVFESEKDGAQMSRVFGRTYLPDHKIEVSNSEVRYLGNGNMCRIDTDDARHSMTLEEAGITNDSLLYRAPDDFGTTIVIVMYDERDAETPRKVEDVAKDFENAIVANFWPMLHEGLLEATVSWNTSTGASAQSPVQIPQAFSPFVRALTCSQDVDIFANSNEPSLLADGEVAYFAAGIQIPERKKEDKEGTGHPRQSDARVAVCVTRLTTEEKASLIEFEDQYPDMKFVNRFAHVRNARMIVENYEHVHGNRSDHIGVVRAGIFRPLDQSIAPDFSDECVEQFLRDSEPPAHDKWTYKDKISSAYKTPWKQVVPNMFNEIETQAKKLLRAVYHGTQDRPDGLADKLRISGHNRGKGGKGTTTNEIAFRTKMIDVQWNLKTQQAICNLEISRMRSSKTTALPKDWQSSIKIIAVGEQGNETLHLLAAVSSDPIDMVPNGSSMMVDSYTVSVPNHIDKYKISVTASLSQLTPAVINRLRIDHLTTSKNSQKI